MLDHLNNKILIIGVFFIVMIGVALNQSYTSVLAQDRGKKMSNLLEELKHKIESEPGFEVTFRFAVPLMDNSEVWWTIPTYNQKEDFRRNLGEIGEDYVCFVDSAGQFPVSRCTPFSNIVTIGFLSGS